MGVRQDTIRLSLFFFLLFTPFSSYMTILTHIYQDSGIPGIGPATLACNYTTFILSTLIAPILKFSLKSQLLFGGICYTLNYSSGILVALTDQAWLKFLISCVGAIVAGLSAGPLWVSQGRYIHLLCVRSRQEKRQGEMFGIFGVLYCLSNISAGLITTFGLGFFNAKVYFLLITVLGAISFAYCFFFVRPIDTLPLSDSTESLIITQPVVQNPKEMLVKVFHFFSKMKMLLTVLILDGVCLGVYSSQIPHLIFAEAGTSKEDINKLAGYLLIALGCGATLGGLLFGKISDKMSTLFTGRLGLFLGIVSCGLFLLTLALKGYGWALLTSFLWGFSLFYVQSWMFLVCGRHFGGRPQAFSVNKQLHSLFYLIFQLVLIPTSNQIPLAPLMLAIAALFIPTIWLIGSVPEDYLKPQALLNDKQ